MAATPRTQTVEVEVSTRTLPHVKHPDLPTALAAFQAEVPTIRKGNEAKVASQKGSYTYQYADLSDVTEKALPLLGKHGLSFTAVPTQTKKSGFVLKYALRHETGGVIKGTYPLPPANTPAQTLGSAITYARRYALTAVTGVAPGGDDDDAHQAQHGPQAAPQRDRKRRGGATSAPRQAKGEPRDKEFRDKAEAAATREEVAAVWQEAKQAVQRGEVQLSTLDAIAAVGQARAAAEQPDDAPTDDQADAVEAAAETAAVESAQAQHAAQLPEAVQA